jgi:hypothetical protein
LAKPAPKIQEPLAGFNAVENLAINFCALNAGPGEGEETDTSVWAGIPCFVSLSGSILLSLLLVRVLYHFMNMREDFALRHTCIVNE